MGSELDLDDAIASILGDSDEENGLSKKKRTSSKMKRSHNKNGKSLNSKALTSSVSEEDFYKNLSKIAEEPSKYDETGLDDLDSDLLGSLGRKTTVTSPRNRQEKDQDNEKHKDLRRKTSSGSLHRRGSVTPFKGEDDDDDALGDLGLTDEESEDALNSSVNSTRSRHRKTGGSKKSPNKISPRVSFDDLEKDTNKADGVKASKAKEINFDSDSDLPGLDNHEVRPAAKSPGKIPVKGRREKNKKPKDDGDLFGDDDDLPDLDGEPEDKSKRSESPAKRASSALDNLMRSKSKTSSQESGKKTPASLDEFMAKVSTAGKALAKSDVQSPIKSPTTEETFQFGGYMPSAVAESGRRSRSNRPESSLEFGRRSVKFSDDKGLDDDVLGVKKRPSTAPAGRKKKGEPDVGDPFNTSLPGKSSKDVKDKSDWLDLGDETEANGSKGDPRERKAEDFSPQASLQGSKSSSSGDWLGLGDDVNLQMDGVETKQGFPLEKAGLKSPQKALVKKNDEELSKMLDIVSDENNNTTMLTEKKFPWEGGKSFGRRRGEASFLKQESQISRSDHDELIPETRQEQNSRTSTTTAQSRIVSDQNLSTDDGPLSSVPHTSPDNRSLNSTPVVNPVGGGADQQQQLRPKADVHMATASPSQQTNSHMLARVGIEDQYRSQLDKERNRMEIELRGMMDRVQEMEKGKHEVEFEQANKAAECDTKIRWLEVENENLVKTFEFSKERHKDEISVLENSHRLRVQAVEESYQRREARQKEETELFITKHKESIRQMEAEKSDLQASNGRKISAVESSKLNEIERLNGLNRRSLEELRNEHQTEMDHLKKMKEQEVSATMTAFSHTKSLQTLMEQVLNSTKQVDDLHHLVEVSHKTSQQDRDVTAKAKDEYLSQLHHRLLMQQTGNEEERSRLQNLVAKMEIHVREQNRSLEEDKWKLSQEDSRLKCLRASLEEERKITREQLETERGLVQRTKNEFLSEQKRMMMEINEERRVLSLERAELTAAQRGILNTEKQKQVNFTKMDVEQEYARIRLAEDTAALNSNETQLRREQEELSRGKRELAQKQEKWDAEKDHIGKLGLELEKRAQEIEELSLEAAKVREDGTRSLGTAQQMQLDIAKQANELESKVLLLQEKERQIATERLAIMRERRELEMEKRRGLCFRCSQLPLAQIPDTNVKWETPPRQLFTSDSSPLSTAKSKVEVVPSPPATPAFPLTPDILVNTLELKRTFRRWSHDKEQDEEFLANENEFLSSLHNSRQQSTSFANSQYSAVS